MTLTSILPSLRRTIPDPMVMDRWPEFTRASVTDLTVAGVSMSRLVDICDTPCVHTAAAVIPGTHGRPSDSDLAAVVATRVLAVDRDHEGVATLWIDARLGGCAPLLTEIRLIGRASTAHTEPFAIISGDSTTAFDVALPHDVAAGDLLVFPCTGATTLRDVRPLPARRVDEDRNEADDPAFRCAR